jgi:hypothetical protein
MVPNISKECASKSKNIEDEGKMFFPEIWNDLPCNAVSHHRRPESSTEF